MSDDYSLVELMVIEAGRQIRPGESVVVGLGLPVLSATVAKLTSRPDFVFTTEVGAFDWQPDPERITRAPVGIHDLSLFPGSGMLSDMADALGAWTHGGNAGCAFLTGAQVDRFGNVNTIVTGDYLAPERRLGGTGGNTDLACSAGRLIILMSLEGRRFVERCDFITSPAYIDGPGGRARAGLAPQGPNVVVSTMGVFGFDTEDGETGSCEMVLTHVFPGFDAGVIQAIIPWELKTAAEVGEVAPPTPEELAWVRRLDPLSMYMREGRY
jgi:glutaconate CoA-transferase subunit B